VVVLVKKLSDARISFSLSLSFRACLLLLGLRIRAAGSTGLFLVWPGLLLGSCVLETGAGFSVLGLELCWARPSPGALSWGDLSGDSRLD
jgi:hypothetical protein